MDNNNNKKIVKCLKVQLTVLALALLDECFVFDVFVAGFTVEPGSAYT
jgi:hypothetical protein